MSENERTKCFCEHCGHYLRPDEGHTEIIEGDIVMLCDSCQSILAPNECGFLDGNEENLKSEGPIEVKDDFSESVRAYENENAGAVPA